MSVGRGGGGSNRSARPGRDMGKRRDREPSAGGTRSSFNSMNESRANQAVQPTLLFGLKCWPIFGGNRISIFIGLGAPFATHSVGGCLMQSRGLCTEYFKSDGANFECRKETDRQQLSRSCLGRVLPPVSAVVALGYDVHIGWEIDGCLRPGSASSE